MRRAASAPSALSLPLPSLPRQLELRQVRRHATRRSLADHRARVGPRARRLPLAARRVLLSRSAARVVEHLGALRARDAARLAQRRAGARAPPRRARPTDRVHRVRRVHLARERRQEVNEHTACAGAHAARRCELERPWRDIVKDVRGSESNCEHDSRKM